jgi:hypothetical protein
LGCRQDPELFLQIPLELPYIIGLPIGQLAFQESPHALIRIEFGGIGGEVCQVKARNPLTQIAKGTAPMGVAVIQECDYMPVKVAENLP